MSYDKPLNERLFEELASIGLDDADAEAATSAALDVLNVPVRLYQCHSWCDGICRLYSGSYTMQCYCGGFAAPRRHDQDDPVPYDGWRA